MLLKQLINYIYKNRGIPASINIFQYNIDIISMKMMTKKENHLKLIPQNNGMCYNSKHNYLTTKINISCTGNTYFSCVRFSNKLSIVFKLGIGNSKVFLNSITVSSYPEGKRHIIGNQLYDSFEYDEAEIVLFTKQIISKEIVEAFNKNKVHYDQVWLKNYIKALVNETMQDQLEIYNNPALRFPYNN